MVPEYLLRLNAPSLKKTASSSSFGGLHLLHDCSRFVRMLCNSSIQFETISQTWKIKTALVCTMTQLIGPHKPGPSRGGGHLFWYVCSCTHQIASIFVQVGLRLRDREPGIEFPHPPDPTSSVGPRCHFSMQRVFGCFPLFLHRYIASDSWSAFWPLIIRRSSTRSCRIL